MLKGYRTYISICCAGIASVLPSVSIIDVEVNQALVVICLAVAAYFRKQA